MLAAVSITLEELIPGGLLGASIIALFMGTVINSFFHPAWTKPALKFSSKRILKLAIVMSTEGDGLSDTTISECDYTVKIPMYHGVDSLNVAAASAVAFYQLNKKM